MKNPATPPKFEELFTKYCTPEKLIKILCAQFNTFLGKKYIHWDKLRFLNPPDGWSIPEWWLAIKLRRKQQYRQLPLKDKNGQSFHYLLAGPILELLHEIDLGAGGTIQLPEPLTNPDTRDRYYVHSLIEEAITSSQLEGAATTRKVAKEMIRCGRSPRDKSEQMILNNYHTMKRLGELKNENLTKELVFEIYRRITQDTLEDPSAANRFRREEENIIVGDDYGEVFHVPPPASELGERMRLMCDFANGKIPKDFIHPLIRSITLHFWLAYDHPFVDGNGRTARALFYWSMLKHGYWLCEYISISNIIRKAPSRYGKSFLYAETDDNDLTYFIDFNGKILQRAVKELHEYILRKTRELHALERRLRGLELFNSRQRALISHALRHPENRYTVESHQTSHNISHRTALLDLQDLVKHNLLRGDKIKKRWYFTPIANMANRLAHWK
jgi:Fic family protein